MDRFNIGRQWLTPTIGISGITEGSYHLSFAGILFYFANFIIFFPHKETRSITECITWYLKFIVINRWINDSASFVVLIILSSRKVFQVSELWTLSLPSWSFKVSSLYLSSSFVFFVFCFFSKIIWTSMWNIIFFR